MKTVTCGYTPAPHFKGATSFLENISRNKITGDYFFVSEHREYGFGDNNLMMFDPALHGGCQQNKNSGVSNLVFNVCLQKAAVRGYTHMLYIESDCRFQGNGWDAVMFEEFASLPFPAIAAGSVVAHSMVNGGGEFYRRFTGYFNRNTGAGRKGLPLPCFGIPSTFNQRVFPPGGSQVVEPGESRDILRNYKPALYPNGAIGIYDVAWMCEIFGMNPDGSWKKDRHQMEVVIWPAWDHVIGMALYDKFGADVFEVVAHLDTCWSSYGDMLSTESDRLQMLRDKKIMGVHQVKSEIAE